MPIRFPTEAANDPGTKERARDTTGAPPVSQDPAQAARERQSRTGAESLQDEEKPGKGINQAGFIHEKDSDNT